MRAQLNTHEREPEIALKNYKQALKVNPASTTPRKAFYGI